MLEPFAYSYMTNAMWVSALVGGVCGFLSAYLMLKGWSLIGDALSHSVVPGVAGAYIIGLPFALGAFLSGGLAAAAMLFLSSRSGLKTDTVIGLIFTAFFGLGLFLISIFPTSVSLQTITMGNILAISPGDTLQLVLIGGISAAVLLVLWNDLMVTFFDEAHARTIGLRPDLLKVVFFTLLSASTVAAMQTVGAFLVVAMVVTPGATAYLLTDRGVGLCRGLSELFSRWCHRRGDRPVADAGLCTGFPLRAETWGAGVTRPGQGRAMIDTLLQPFQFPFMQNAFLIALIVAPPCALLSCFLVLKGWALMGDAVSHAVLPGIVIAYMAGWPLLAGAFVAGLGSSLLTGYLADNSRIKRDTVMGVVFSAMFALGIVLHTAFPSELHLDHVLFGNMLGVGRADLVTAAAIALPVTVLLALKWRDLMLHAFDPAQAKVSGLQVGVLHYGLLAILSLTIVATLSSVGLILAIGLLITPGAIAFLLTRRFGMMLILATLITVGAMLLGVWLCFYLDSAPAPTIILVLTTLFLMALTRHSLRTRAG